MNVRDSGRPGGGQLRGPLRWRRQHPVAPKFADTLPAACKSTEKAHHQAEYCCKQPQTGIPAPENLQQSRSRNQQFRKIPDNAADQRPLPELPPQDPAIICSLTVVQANIHELTTLHKGRSGKKCRKVANVARINNGESRQFKGKYTAIRDMSREIEVKHGKCVQTSVSKR